MKAILTTFIVLFLSGNMMSQSVGINDNGSSPNPKAMLDVNSSTKGFLPPRMTYAQKSAIAGPPAGLIVWCSNCGTNGELQIYNGTSWTSLIAGTPSGLPGAPTIGTATAGIAQASVTFSAPADNGGSAIVSYIATSSPGGITGTLNQAGSGTITVTGLTIGTSYTFTVTATNSTGTGAASAASNSATPVSPVIGESFQGGIIFYIDGTGQHGLISATVDQSTSIAWITGGSTQTTTNGNTLTAVGTGHANTNYMMAQTGYTGGAATVCHNYTVTVGDITYNDWFLPSQAELHLMYTNINGSGGFVQNIYWSSSEYSANNAWYQWFNNGYQFDYTKNTTLHVRAVRAF